ncbi:MAG: mannose-1-phosphate guanylyltransferase/mannose-6-phosphate isomerase [SAR324 cluster bacterium]|nr:mannose-1-phosphate guanylyltransferase/mannose-6-phosphate isomerase [SAR324 cluster bacterium]
MLGMILAGGGGTRLWPFSRYMSPKQFLNLGSTHESLLQETYQRLSSLVLKEDIFIVGSTHHEFELIHQIDQIAPDFPRRNLLFEPQGRNTAPAILWAVFCVSKSNLDEPMIILPADHLIPDREGFHKYLQQGAVLAREKWIVTFGIKPEHPETGYGYIKSGNPLSQGFRVEKFVEKPDQATAEKYLDSGKYTWNSGIFMCTPRVLMEEYQKQVPEMFEVFSKYRDTGKSFLDEDVINAIYGEVQADSIDYAILEKSDRVSVLPLDIAWSDLGSWESIHQVSKKDDENNAIQGNVVLHDTRNCLIFTTKKLVTSIGIENLIIVETDDALLVCDLSRSQDVKKLVDTLKEEDRYEYKFHRTILRRWGRSTILYETPGYQIKNVEILPGMYLSRQRHQHRSEHWIVVKGTADVLRDDEQFLLNESESTHIPRTIVHRLGNPGTTPLEIIEIQLGEHLDDDIERLEQ